MNGLVIAVGLSFSDRVWTVRGLPLGFHYSVTQGGGQSRRGCEGFVNLSKTGAGTNKGFKKLCNTYVTITYQ